MALSNAEFEKIADNCETLPKMDVLIAVLNKLSEDFLFLLPYVSTGDPDEMVFGKAYLDPNTDYMFNVPEELFGEEKYSELMGILEAIQSIPVNCNMKELFIDSVDDDDDSDDNEKVIINKKNIQILRDLGYDVIISFDSMTEEELGTVGMFGSKGDDVVTFTDVNIIAGPYIIRL